MRGGEGLRESDELVKAALRHFGEYGFDAAKAAQHHAEAALAAGDEQGFDWWLGICGTLDRKLAAQLANRTGDTAIPA